MIAIGHEMQYQVDATDGHGGTIGAMTCYCNECVRSFREWIASQYDSIETYNGAHKRQIERFSEISPPIGPNAIAGIGRSGSITTLRPFRMPSRCNVQ